MGKEKPLVDKKYLLEKFPGQGGWTYATIPEISPNKEKPFGWVTVKGKIDDHELKQHKLMPMGDGQLFLPVKALIRKQIKKAAGDFVHVILYLDETPVETPKEILDCFEMESTATLNTYQGLSEGEKKVYLDWIYSAKKAATKAERIAKMMERLEKGLKFYDK